MGLAVLPGRFRFELAAAYWAGQTTFAPSNPLVKGDFSLITGALRAGYVFPLGPLELIPLLVAEEDFLSGTGRGLSMQTSGSSRSLGLGAGALGTWRVTRAFAVRLGGEAVVPLAIPTFNFAVGTPKGATSTVFQPGAVGGKGAIGLELRFL